MDFLKKLEEKIGNIVNDYEDKKERKNYYWKIENKKLYTDLVNNWNEAKKINFIVNLLSKYYLVDYVNNQSKHSTAIYALFWKKNYLVLDIDWYSKNWDKHSDNEAIKDLLQGLGYKWFELSENYCLKKPKSCILFPMFHWRFGSYFMWIHTDKFTETYIDFWYLSRILATKWLRPLDILIFAKRNFLWKELASLVLYRDKNLLKEFYKNEVDNNILTNLSWFEILKAYTDPQVIKANYIIGQEMNNWVGLTEKEIDFYTKWWDYTFKIYVKAEKGSEAYKERIEKWWFKEVKDLWNGIVLLMKEEKVHLEKPILTKEEWEILKKLLTEWKRKILEEKWELKNLKNESKKLQSEIRWNSTGNHKKLHNVLQERLKKEK